MQEINTKTHPRVKIPPVFLNVLKMLHIPPNTPIRIVSAAQGSYNTVFDYTTGLFARWGKTTAFNDNPSFSPLGPEILDLEISTICHGIDGTPCKWCYKSNTGTGTNMTFDTFKTIFHKMPKNLTQIAFGIGDIDSNPDMWRMFEYCRHNDYNYVVPNVTINGWHLTDAYADRLAQLCGAVAVSHYTDDVCFDAIQKLTDRGMSQINIHQLVAEETFDACMKLLDQQATDPRLAKMNAIVFLSLKQKGRGTGMHPMTPDHYQQLIAYAMEKHARFGMDSCSAFKFLSCMQHRSDFAHYQTVAEPCESSCFSAYLNVDGKFFPCSFTEDSDSAWMEADGLDVVHCNDFMKDIWMHPKTVAFRNTLLATTKKNAIGCRECPLFKI